MGFFKGLVVGMFVRLSIIKISATTVTFHPNWKLWLGQGILDIHLTVGSKMICLFPKINKKYGGGLSAWQVKRGINPDFPFIRQNYLILLSALIDTKLIEIFFLNMNINEFFFHFPINVCHIHLGFKIFFNSQNLLDFKARIRTISFFQANNIYLYFCTYCYWALNDFLWKQQQIQ